MKKKDIKVGFYAAVSNTGKVLMFIQEPIRDNATKTWKGSPYYINSKIYPEIKNMMVNANKTWEDDPEYFEATFVMSQNIQI